jgi:hypothetical protein
MKCSIKTAFHSDISPNPGVYPVGQNENGITNPTLSQDYNRYSYVRNNPLKYTDPSGYLVGGGGEDPTIMDKRLYRHGRTWFGSLIFNFFNHNLFEYTGYDVCWVDNFSFIGPLAMESYSAPGSSGTPGLSGTMGGGPAPDSGDPPPIIDPSNPNYYQQTINVMKWISNNSSKYKKIEISNLVEMSNLPNKYFSWDTSLMQFGWSTRLSEIKPQFMIPNANVLVMSVYLINNSNIYIEKSYTENSIIYKPIFVPNTVLGNSVNGSVSIIVPAINNITQNEQVSGLQINFHLQFYAHQQALRNFIREFGDINIYKQYFKP